jgi:GNAT superfamily N-acetyltransferase
MWRNAVEADDEALVAMCSALNAEDPGPDPVPEEYTRRTLRTLRAAPTRGRAMVLELAGCACGYALLISSWSNELGGEVCVIDELFVVAGHRGHGHAGRFLDELAAGTVLGPDVVALTLETTPENVAARRLYERHGFRARNVAMRRRMR